MTQWILVTVVKPTCPTRQLHLPAAHSAISRVWLKNPNYRVRAKPAMLRKQHGTASAATGRQKIFMAQTKAHLLHNVARE
eukprot:3783626-Amphidinium_carterae.2